MASLRGFHVFSAVVTTLKCCCRLRSSSSSAELLQLLKQMPKDKVHVPKLRETRKKKGQSNSVEASANVTLHVLGNGSVGNPRALFLTTDNRSYLFNCGEGTQRLAHEHKLKLSKLEHIFFTRRICENISGLVGLSLTCHDIGVPSLTLHGPPQMDYLFHYYKSFMSVEGMTISGRSFAEGSFSDSVMTVDIHLIEKCCDGQPFKKLKSAPVTKDMTFMYVCTLKNRPGELDIMKCKELKVPPGPLLGQLKAGQDVLLPDNRIIRSCDVVKEEEKGRIFMVLECPTQDFIDSLISNKLLENYFDVTHEKYQLTSFVVHFSPSNVVQDSRYVEWMNKFHPDVVHLICNEESPSTSFLAVNRLQTQLNLLDPFIFPMINNGIETKKIDNQIIDCPSMLKFVLRPKNRFGIDSELVSSLDYEGFKQEAFDNEGFGDALKEYHDQVAKIRQDNSCEYPETVFFGTGSAIPSKLRNTSAILINISNDTSFLLDCGEGTFGQFFRFYGDETDNRLRTLKAIYISHLHADHHLGLLNLIKKRSTVTDEPIYLIIPPVVKRWISEYHNKVEPIEHLCRQFPCEFFNFFNDKKDESFNCDEVLKLLKLRKLETVLVRHCKDAYGICFTTATEPSFKISYSGDAMPSDQLTAISKNCDLLVHEATMEDDLEDEATIKQHSTTSQAIQMGRDMEARFTILTHFSQRYAKLPLLNQLFDERVGVAFDNMRVRMCDLKKLPFMLPVLKLHFNEHYEEMQARTSLKLKKRQLINKYLESETIQLT